MRRPRREIEASRGSARLVRESERALRDFSRDRNVVAEATTHKSDRTMVELDGLLRRC
jgi:hypothetical protein